MAPGLSPSLSMCSPNVRQVFIVCVKLGFYCLFNNSWCWCDWVSEPLACEHFSALLVVFGNSSLVHFVCEVLTTRRGLWGVVLSLQLWVSVRGTPGCGRGEHPAVASWAVQLCWECDVSYHNRELPRTKPDTARQTCLRLQNNWRNKSFVWIFGWQVDLFWVTFDKKGVLMKGWCWPWQWE